MFIEIINFSNCIINKKIIISIEKSITWQSEKKPYKKSVESKNVYKTHLKGD